MEFYLVIQAIFHKLGKFSVSRYLHSEIDLIPKLKFEVLLMASDSNILIRANN